MFRILRILILMVILGCCNLAQATTLRVAVVHQQDTISLIASEPFLVKDLAEGTEKKLSKGKYFLNTKFDRIYFDEQLSFSHTLALEGLEGKGLPMINGRNYPGKLRLLLENNALTLVNQVDLETYLAQILPSKTMVVWPDEVIKAQAVAARSYALNRQAASTTSYDLLATDSELTYIGITKYTEKAAITKLLKATEGQYMADYSGRPILGLTTSSTGGQTDNARQVLGQDYSYLVSVKDYDQDSPEFTWELRIAPGIIKKMLEERGYKIGTLNSVRLSPLKEPGMDRSSNGRVKFMIFAGDKGNARIDGEDIVQLLKLNSNLFDVETGTPIPESLKVPIENSYGMEVGTKDIPIKVNEGDTHVWSNFRRSVHMLSGGTEEKITFKGKGKGHGLGLSAWGARGLTMEKENITYEDILKYYYPGTYLVR